MGSADLLQLVKSVHQPVHIKEYAGKTVAVDGRRGGALLWHSLVSTNANHGVVVDNDAAVPPLFTDNSNDDDKDDDNNNNNENDDNNNDHDKDETNNNNDEDSSNDNEPAAVKKSALLQQLDILRSYNVTPLVVLEGNVLPCDKKKTKGNDDDDHENNNDNNDNDDEKTMQEQKDAFLKHLEKEKIKYIQAPFESGAQLAYLIETKRVEAALFVDDINEKRAGDGIAFGCQVMLFGLQSDGNATRLQLSDLITTTTTTTTCAGDGSANSKKIELRDWSLKSVCELCLMCDDCANVQVERAHSLFVKHKKNMRLALQEVVDTKKDVETIYKRMACRWSQKVYDDKLRRNVSWHKDPALKVKNTNKSTTTTTTNTSTKSDKKSVKTIRLHQDNKENIPPWLNRTSQEATSQAVHRDNPEPPQQAPKVVAAEQIIKAASASPPPPLAAKKENNQATAEYRLLQHEKLADSSPSKAKTMATMPPRPKLMDKKRKSLDGIDDENSPAGTRGDDTVSNKKRGSQSLPLRRRFGLSDSSNRRHLF